MQIPILRSCLRAGILLALGLTLPNSTQAQGAVDYTITLTELDSNTLQISGPGKDSWYSPFEDTSGNALALSPDSWALFVRPFADGVHHSFIFGSGGWAEPEAGAANIVAAPDPSGIHGELVINSDVQNRLFLVPGILAADGTPLNFTALDEEGGERTFTVTFIDQADETVTTTTPDSGATAILLLGASSLITFLRRVTQA